MRIAHDFDLLESQGFSADVALATMWARSGSYDLDLLGAFARLRASADRSVRLVEVELHQVDVGMVFVDELRSESGSLLIPGGQEVGQGLLERIRNLPSRTAQTAVRVIVRDSGPRTPSADQANASPTAGAALPTIPPPKGT